MVWYTYITPTIYIFQLIYRFVLALQQCSIRQDIRFNFGTNCPKPFPPKHGSGGISPVAAYRSKQPREETLKLFVLQRIFDVTALFFDDAMAFEEAAKKQHFQEAEKEAQKRKREIAQAEKRIAELDRIFKRIYEDDISGTISHERFLKLSTDYEAEQRELTEQVKTWREVVEIFEQDRSDFDSFAAIVRKYVGIRGALLAQRRLFHLLAHFVSSVFS